MQQGIAKSEADGILFSERITCKIYIFNQHRECQAPAFGNTQTLHAILNDIYPTT